MIRTTRTAAETAAFKAANLAQRPSVVWLQTTKKPVRQTQRQEWQELLSETIEMIDAALREGHLHIVPALVQRRVTFEKLLQARCF